MSDQNTIMTDGGEPVRKNHFESDDAETDGGLDASGHFAKAIEDEDGEATEKEEGDETEQVEKDANESLNLSGAFGSNAETAIEKSADVDAGDADDWASIDIGDDGSGDGGGEQVEKSVPSHDPSLGLDKSGSFLSREERLLGEIRDALVDHDEDVQAAVEKAVGDATGDGDDEATDLEDDSGDSESGGEGDLADAYKQMLTESEAVVEDAEALVEADAEGKEWSDLKERVEGLIERMHDAPAPETPAEVASVETLRDRATKLTDLLDTEEDGAGEGVESDADGEEGAEADDEAEVDGEDSDD